MFSAIFEEDMLSAQIYLINAALGLLFYFTLVIFQVAFHIFAWG
jgi:hypothetical protein